MSNNDSIIVTNKRKRTILFDNFFQKSINVPQLNLNNLTIKNFNTELDLMERQLKLDQVYLREKRNQFLK